MHAQELHKAEVKHMPKEHGAEGIVPFLERASRPERKLLCGVQ
jgi:hypothetical protein